VLDPLNPLGDTFVGTITLENKPTTCPPTACPPPPNPPRYQTYPAPPSAAGAATSGEPSIGVDWTPNVAGLKHGTVNRGGGVFFTSNFNEYRVDLDDCSSPAIATWTDVTTPIETDPASLDPSGSAITRGHHPRRAGCFNPSLRQPRAASRRFLIPTETAGRSRRAVGNLPASTTRASAPVLIISFRTLSLVGELLGTPVRGLAPAVASPLRPIAGQFFELPQRFRRTSAASVCRSGYFGSRDDRKPAACGRRASCTWLRA
jgi:hypothetical protein